VAITRKDVDYVAHLSRIDMTEDEAAALTAQLEKIVGYVDKLAELDVSRVEPLAFATEAGNVLRKDVPRDGITREDALGNAPAAGGGYFRVPPVIEGGTH